MYDINLIRKKVVPQRQKHVMFSVISLSALAYILTFLAIVFFSTANFRMIDAYGSEVERLQEELSVLYPGTPTQDELSAIIRRIKPDLDEIGRLIDRKTQTTYLWEGIATALPDSVWLTAIHLRIPEGGAGKKERSRSRGGAGLIIEGMVISSRGGGSGLIRRFAERLEVAEELRDFVSGAKYVETGKQDVGDIDVVGFEITCPFH